MAKYQGLRICCNLHLKNHLIVKDVNYIHSVRVASSEETCALVRIHCFHIALALLEYELLEPSADE